MRWITILGLRLRSGFRRDQAEGELDEELRDHLEREIAANCAAGMTPEQARYAALRAIGGLEQWKEACRDARGFATLDEIRRDVRHAVRVLWKSRTATVVALITLALAIGATTAIFTVVDALLLRSLPFPEADRLVQLGSRYPDFFAPYTSVPKFVSWRNQGAQLFVEVAAIESRESGFNLAGFGRPERLIGSRVSAGFFRVLGVEPALGRAFRQAEDVPGGPRLVVLSHALWTNRFGGWPNIVGQAITLNTEPYTVVGVTPDGFRYPDAVDLWTLAQLDPDRQSRANRIDEVIARLKPDTRLEQARAAMEVAATTLRQAGVMNEAETIAVRPLRQRLYGDMRAALLVLFASVGFVLLIACVNVANLQLAQAADRHHEIALRTALGATRWTVVRQLLVESLLLATISGLAGVALANLGVPALLSLNPAHVAYADRIAVDWRVLGFAIVISAAAGVTFGLLPAWQSARPNLDAVLRAGAHRMISRTSQWTRCMLVAGEVALALMLTIGAFLLVKSLAALLSTNPGFRAEHVLTMKLSLAEARYGTGKALAQFQERVEERLGTLPGVRAAGLAVALPLEHGPNMPFTIEGRYVPGTETGVGNADYRAVSAGYFEALQIPLQRGRLFGARDRRGTLPVAIVNEAAARRIWPGEDPIGHRIIMGQPFLPELADPTAREIVGIVGDVLEQGLAEAPPQILYVPLSQQNDAMTALLTPRLPLAVTVRGDVAVAGLTRSVQQAIWSVDPQQPIADIRLMREIVARSLGPQTFNTVLLGGLAVLALLLAAVGLYGVIAHIVSQQTREIGVRMALGATRAAVLGLFLRQAASLVVLGIVVGLAGALGVTRVLQTLLAGVSPTDPWVFALAPALMLAVALVAALRPALRAARVDPARALRAE